MIPFTPHRVSDSPAGRRVTHPTLTAHQIKLEADKLLLQGLSPQAEQTLQYLAVGGLMSASQLERLGVKLRTLQKYAQKQLLARLPRPSTEMVKMFGQWGLPCEPENPQNTLLYLLGSVGLEIAERKNLDPEEGFLAFSEERLMHQVVLNEIRIRLSLFALEQGWQVTWADRGQARLMAEDETVLLEPAAMLFFEKGADKRAFLVDYLTNSSPIYLERLVSTYEKARRSERWQAHWGVEYFPPLLMGLGNHPVGQAFLDAIRNYASGKCPFYVKLLGGIVSEERSLGEWTNFNTNSREVILS